MPTDRSNQIAVDDNKIYLITGKSLNEILAAIKRNRPLAGTHIKLSETEEGIFIAADDCDPCPT